MSVEDVEFVVLGRNFSRPGSGPKKVHVLGDRPTPFARTMSKESLLVHGYIGSTLCGREVFQYRGGGRTDEFSDDDLCVSCYRAFKGEKHRLFEHDVPGEDDD